MRLSAIRMLMIAGIVAGSVGCQSGPRWAWWKRDQAPEDTSLVARSAAPTLPSAASTPQAIAATGLQPAAPPSSANLAASGAPPAIPSISIPTTSPSTTIANAPLAAYPSANVAPAASIAATSPVAAPAGSVSAGTPLQSAAVASVPSTGPYDPKGYQPTTLLAATPAGTPGSATPDPDRYSMAATDATLPPTPDRYAPAATPAVTPTGMDRYGQVQPDRYGGSATTPQVGQSPAIAVQSMPATAAIAPPIATATAPMAAAPGVAATVQLTSPPGQYRPGGTSSYTSGGSAQHVELAARPAPPVPSYAPTPQAGASPTGTSIPWTPSAPVTPNQSTGAGIRTY